MFLKGHSAANTGSTSGIGLAYARALAAEATDLLIDDVLPEAQPTKQIVAVDQVSALAVFLCTDAAKPITGATLPMDGGWTAE